MEARKGIYSKANQGSHKCTTSRSRAKRSTLSVHPVKAGGNICSRSIYRANVIKRATASKKSAIAFLAKAGILDKSGELTPLYQ